MLDEVNLPPLLPGLPQVGLSSGGCSLNMGPTSREMAKLASRVAESQGLSEDKLGADFHVIVLLSVDARPIGCSYAAEGWRLGVVPLPGILHKPLGLKLGAALQKPLVTRITPRSVSFFQDRHERVILQNGRIISLAEEVTNQPASVGMDIE